MKRALVCGAGGFIGGHLVTYLKGLGYWVRGVDLRRHQFRKSDADQFMTLDLREPHNCWKALNLYGANSFDEVYQLAADMGGMGYIHKAECDIMRNSALINIHMLFAAMRSSVPHYFFSSSACVYPDMPIGTDVMTEDDVYPAYPDNEYGWEKLYAERMALTYDKHHHTNIKIARFNNVYGPYCAWSGGREKAPAALCRKAVLAPDGGDIEVWGDGSAVRSYTSVHDLIYGIYMLMHSDVKGPVNIGSDDKITVDELALTIVDASEKNLAIRYVEGPVGVQARNFSKEKIKSTGWQAKVLFREGIEELYAWVNKQVHNS